MIFKNHEIDIIYNIKIYIIKGDWDNNLTDMITNKT